MQDFIFGNDKVARNSHFYSTSTRAEDAKKRNWTVLENDKMVVGENSWLFLFLAEQQVEEELIMDRNKEKAAMYGLMWQIKILTCATVSYAKYAKISIATTLGFISILLQSNQSRNLEAFLASH